AIDVGHGARTISPDPAYGCFAIRNVTSFCGRSGRAADLPRWRTIRLFSSGDSTHSKASPTRTPGVVAAESHSSLVSSRPPRVVANERASLYDTMTTGSSGLPA